MEKIKDFIEKNNINFNDDESGLNSACCIVAGYCCFLSDQGVIMTPDEIVTYISSITPTSIAFEKEFLRVHKYAWSKGYGKYWESEEAKNSYTF